jgi:hypothetical protein
MLKSIASKLVSISASAVLASAIIASSASALTVPQTAVYRPCEWDSPQITLTSTGEVQGTGFCPGTTAVIDFEDSVSSQGFEGYSYAAANSYPTVSADGTFTTPLVYSSPPEPYLTAALEVIAHDHNGNENNSSNTLVVTISRLVHVF